MGKSYNKISDNMFQLGLTNLLLKEGYILDDEDYDVANEEYLDDDEKFFKDKVDSEKIDQIRQLAIEGLQEYANDVDSEIYMFFKKIFLECDKVRSNKEKNDKKTSND